MHRVFDGSPDRRIAIALTNIDGNHLAAGQLAHVNDTFETCDRRGWPNPIAYYFLLDCEDISGLGSRRHCLQSIRFGVPLCLTCRFQFLAQAFILQALTLDFCLPLALNFDTFALFLNLIGFATSLSLFFRFAFALRFLFRYAIEPLLFDKRVFAPLAFLGLAAILFAGVRLRRR